MQTKIEIESFTRNIGGEPYHFTRLDECWRVTAVDRLGHARPFRSYLVWVRADGYPLTCDCPHHAKTRKLCKHMRACDQLYLESHPEVRRNLEDQAVRAGAVSSRLDQIAAEQAAKTKAEFRVEDLESA